MNRKIFNELEKTLEAEGKSSGTYREYFANIGYFEKFFAGKNLKDITQAELQNYIDYLNNEYTKTTYNNHIAALRYLYKKIIKKPKMLEILNLKRIREKKEK